MNKITQKKKRVLSMMVVFAMATSYMPMSLVEAGINKEGVHEARELVNLNSENSVKSNFDNISNSSSASNNNNISSGKNDERQAIGKEITDKNTINLGNEFKLVKVDSKGEKKDSDNDGISDNREIMIGTDPFKKDSDNNGIPDVREVYNTKIGLQGYEKDPNVDVSISCNIKGENVDDIILANMEGSHSFITKDIPGYIGAPFRVGIYKEDLSQDVKIAFKVNLQAVRGNEIGLYVYNKEGQSLEEVKDGIIKNNNEIILNTTLTHDYKEYVLLSKDKWNDTWNKEILSPNTKFQEANVVLAIDSAKSNDEMLKKEGEKFINSLQGENKEAIVNIKSNNPIAAKLTNNKKSLLSTINNINSTNDRELGIANGLKYAIKALVPEVAVVEKLEVKEEQKDVRENTKKDIKENSEKDIKAIEKDEKVQTNKSNNKDNINIENKQDNTNISSEKKTNEIKEKNNSDNAEAAKVEIKNNKIITEYTNLPQVGNNKARYIVLFSDENSQIDINDPSIVYAKNNGIKIFTVSLSNNGNEDTLMAIAKATGGEYLNASNLEKRDELLDKLSSKVVDLITDNDADGIPNYYEQNLRLVNGLILKLDPNKSDTDGDGLSDSMELFGKAGNINILRYSYDESKKAFSFNSRPDIVDTDFDGINDGQDNEPKKKNVTDTTLLKFSDICYQELKQEYVGNKVKEIKASLGNSYYNGNITRDDINKWNIIDLDNGKGYMAGFGALAVVDSRNLIVAFPGTGADLGDIAADASIVAGSLGNSNYQTTQAKEFMEKVLKKLRGKIDNVFITGHSLGGYLAQYVVYNCLEEKLTDKTLTRDVDIKGTTFNSARFSSPKALQDEFTMMFNKNTPSDDIFGDNGKYKDIITNYRIEWDPVSSSLNGSFVGKTVELDDRVWDIPGIGAHMLYNFYEHFN